MKKILTIANREYRAMVATKAFLISMIMMPLLMFGGLFAMQLLQNVGEINDRKIMVIDHSGVLYEPLELAAKKHNQQFDKNTSVTVGLPENSGDTDDSSGPRNEDDNDDFGPRSRSRYLLQRWDRNEITDSDRLELSNQIRRQELYAFVEIPADILTADIPTNLKSAKNWPAISFYAEDSSISGARSWLNVVANAFIRQQRLMGEDIDADLVNKLSIETPVRGLSLLEKTSAGEIQAGVVKNDLTAIFLPFGVLMLMFMVIFMASQPMLESVLEEKSQRIAEVLLGSANPFQLMAGKLLGTVAGSFTIFTVYLGGAYFLAAQRGWTEHIPLNLIPWFVVFQIGGVLFYAAIFLAVGASVTQLKEAQSLLLPVWMLLMSPLFVWFLAIREPKGALATYFSLFPPATPTMMMLRLSTGTTIPVWQPILGLILLAISTFLIVYMAARIFRVGLLWQGKTPRINEIIKWAFRG